MRRIVFLILRWSGLPFLLWALLQRNKVTILCYHDPAPEIMVEHLRVLKRLYTLIPLRAYIQARQAGTTAQLPVRALVITSDDGHRGNHRLISVIRKQNVPITIFLCSGIIGTHRHYWWTGCKDFDTVRAMKRVDNEERIARLAESGYDENKEYPDRQALSREEIDELRTLVDLQAHTRFHPILPRCGDELAWDEIDGSKNDLVRNYGLDIYALAYPNGDYSERDIELTKKSGYECALTLDGGYNDNHTDLFCLQRIPIDDSADDSELLVKASGFWDFLQTILGRRQYGYHR